MKEESNREKKKEKKKKRKRKRKKKEKKSDHDHDFFHLLMNSKEKRIAISKKSPVFHHGSLGSNHHLPFPRKQKGILRNSRRF